MTTCPTTSRSRCRRARRPRRGARSRSRRSSQRLAVREFEDEGLALGQQWEDGRGVLCAVHVRVQMLVDYIDYAQSSGTKQNQACPAGVERSLLWEWGGEERGGPCVL